MEVLAARTAAAKRVFFLRSSFSGASGHVCTALMISFKCFLQSLDPVTREATFCSSFVFQLMYSSISGWSRSSVTILAARRVVPPDLMAPAARSPILRKDMRPDDFPPPESGSPDPRMSEKVEPGPGPDLKMRGSLHHRTILAPGVPQE